MSKFEEKIMMADEEPLHVGDVVEVHTRSTGLTWVQAWQWYQIEKAVNKDPHFEVVNTEYGDRHLIIRVRVVKNPIVVAVLTKLIIGAAVTAGFVWLTVEGVYKITSSESGQALIGGVANWGIAAILGGLYMLTKKG